MSNDIQKMSQDFQHRVREAAYFMWEAAGRPLGSAMQFWVEAEQQVFKTMQVATEAMLPSARNDAAAKPAEKPAETAVKPAETAEKPGKKSATSAEPKKPAKTAASGKQTGKTEASGKQTGKTEKNAKAAASGASGDKKQSEKPAAKTASKPAGKTKKAATTKKP